MKAVDRFCALAGGVGVLGLPRLARAHHPADGSTDGSWTWLILLGFGAIFLAFMAISALLERRRVRPPDTRKPPRK
jgi:hypothetical protein